MNNSYYATLDENFMQALNLFEAVNSYEELIEFLNSGNIVQRQVSALKLETIKSSEDARILMSNLVGQDGKIREVVSLKLYEFMTNPELRQFFENPQIYKIFLEAIIDINPNICRNTISAIANLKNNKEFCNIFCSGVINITYKLLNQIEKFDFKEGKYKVNKEIFKLYWCLETIYELADKFKFEDLKIIILKCKNIQEYTIREKAAKILSCIPLDEELQSVRKVLQNDSNYYVRRF